MGKISRKRLLRGHKRHMNGSDSSRNKVLIYLQSKEPKQQKELGRGFGQWEPHMGNKWGSWCSFIASCRTKIRVAAHSFFCTLLHINFYILAPLYTTSNPPYYKGVLLLKACHSVTKNIQRWLWVNWRAHNSSLTAALGCSWLMWFFFSIWWGSGLLKSPSLQSYILMTCFVAFVYLDYFIRLWSLS